MGCEKRVDLHVHFHLESANSPVDGRVNACIGIDKTDDAGPTPGTPEERLTATLAPLNAACLAAHDALAVYLEARHPDGVSDNDVRVNAAMMRFEGATSALFNEIDQAVA